MMQNCYMAWVRSWHFCDMVRSRMDFRFRRKSGRAADIAPMAEVDPELTLAPRAQRTDSEQFRSAPRTLPGGLSLS
jgi:hypothetical protein